MRCLQLLDTLSFFATEFPCPFPLPDGGTCANVYQNINGLQYHMTNGHTGVATRHFKHLKH
jgi:hypothetical protein